MIPDNINIQSLSDRWEKILFDHFKSDIDEQALKGEKSIYINWYTLDEFDSDLAYFTLRRPAFSILAGGDALKNIDVSADTNTVHNIRIRDLPEISHRDISSLRVAHLGSLISVDGIVRKVTEVRPRIEDAAFQCLRCGAVIRMPQEGDVLKEPTECYEDQGGCGRRTHFKLLAEVTDYIDSQKIQIQENPEGMRAGQPQSITIYMEDDIAGTVFPGDRVTVNGILTGKTRWSGKKSFTTLGKVIEGVSVVHKEYAFEDIEVSPDDEKLIKETAKDPFVFDSFIGSIAPTIYGMRKEKEAMLLQLFGGVPKKMPDGTRIRGDIHILLVGDPGLAKSQLINYIAKLAPRSVVASGKGSSSAGLTVSAVKDSEFGGAGKWTLEAGALVLADMGLCAVDELDKMDARDVSAMHQAMSTQEIPVNKAGINTVLKSRCAVLAAANPVLGRFDPYGNIVEQINLPPALLSRFDMIFPILDRPDEVRDGKLADHILKAHRTGELTNRGEAGKWIEVNSPEYMENVAMFQPVFDTEFIRKYISFAKMHIMPVMSEAAMGKIKEYYITLRKASTTSISITPRQIEAVIRMAEASARVRLSRVVGLEDANRAIGMMEYYMQKVLVDRNTGFIDADVVESGITHSEKVRLSKLMRIIDEMEQAYGIVNKEDLVKGAEGAGISRETIEGDIEKLKQRGYIFEPRFEKYKKIIK